MFFRLLALTAFSISMASCTGASSQRESDSPKPQLHSKVAVTIVKKPAYISRGGFIEYSNLQSSRGLTDWVFHCYPSLEYELKSTKTAEKTTVTILVRKITLTISLPITVRIGKLAGKKTVDHENGHIQIVKQVYEKAEDAAREACETVIDARFEGTGVSREDAIADASDKVYRQVCQLYRAKTVDAVNALSKNFDDITYHGRAPVSVKEAIKLSFEKYTRESKTP
ncbi:MAG: hypothetical protein JST89_16065 [Cyanobacteria bacterium SZAS-4]|nr:hypothetical protein [Cyanobacteria bacterium SZAS-4]